MTIRVIQNLIQKVLILFGLLKGRTLLMISKRKFNF